MSKPEWKRSSSGIFIGRFRNSTDNFRSSSQGSNSDAEYDSSSSYDASSFDELRSSKENRFIVSKPVWAKKSDASTCNVCEGVFNVITRKKHHCRACGEVVCARCSTLKLPLRNMGYNDPQRVCDHCFTRISNDTSKIRASGNKGKEDFGLSHSFEQVQFVAPTFCTLCSSLIWGCGLQQGYQCSVCKYTAHKLCCCLVPNTCSLDIIMDSSKRFIDAKEIEQLWQMWLVCCPPKKGVEISQFVTFYTYCVKQELSKAEKKVGVNIDDHEAVKLFRLVDRDNNGTVTFEEYVVFVSKLRDPSPEDILNILFYVYDTDGNGYLTKQEMKEAIQKSTTFMFSSFSQRSGFGEDLEATVDNIFQIVDSNKDGKLTLSEILEANKRDPQILSCFFSSSSRK